ncbi:MAG TPA: hypothetical protein PLS53_15185 [Thermoanaerobaculaceae bacterium]|nr:hypothetical protein [Thermoanaerobaculaceae bacterium]
MRATLGLVVALVAAPVAGQTIDWRSSFLFYGDNTEFFTPYRKGETILGSSFTTALAFRVGPRSEVVAGVFGDVRSGSGERVDDVKAVLSFRHRTATSLGVLGTLVTENRHGYLEPLEATTLELTRQVEQGLQWVETRDRWRGEAYVNWQHLNTSESREIFDYGIVASWRAWRRLHLEGQLHGLHHGGQLHQVGPVTNNVVKAGGVRGEWDLGAGLTARAAAFYLSSNGKLDPYRAGPTVAGHGVYLRTGLTIGRVGEASAIWWRGRDFISTEGDHNYGSVGNDGVFYRSRRTYQELAFVHRRKLGDRVELAAEARLHRIDGDVDYSYRIVVRAPFELRLR